MATMLNETVATVISAKQCKQILQKYNEEHETDLKLLSFSVSPAEEVKGFLGEYFHLNLLCTEMAEATAAEAEVNENDEELCEEESNNRENDEFEDDFLGQSLKFFIKKLPLVHELHEKVVIFRKECRLYSSLLMELQEYSPQPWCPKVYLSSSQLLVLQDLEDSGYHSLNNKDQLEDSEIFAIIKGLAAMHASSLLYELYDKTIEDNYYDCLKEITVHPDIPWFTTGLRALIQIAKLHPNFQEEVSQEFIDKELPYHLKSVYFMVNPSPKYRNVVCHRDTWGGNIFLNSDDPDAAAMFVDFQTCRYCPPVIDVIFTFFMNLTKEERVARENEYLHYYWSEFKRILAANDDDDGESWGLSETEFFESYEEFKLFGYVYRALAVTILKVPKEMVTEEYKNVERTEPLLRYMEENEEFRLLMDECVEDVIEAVVEIRTKEESF
ncbi:uncharacterized protein LOC101894549 [Musca domestica]|uniref:Uncharacterized protein LOC101894549 n=1 Tax=Musca domestica TaxID=7370 RepID=A0A1I8M2K7_MUSDO|nr:uncharacterized protein LOC101894549 [Musca domestica]